MESEILLILSTLYKGRNEVELLREKLALESFRLAQNHGYSVISIDGGSDSRFIEESFSLGVAVYSYVGATFGEARRLGIQKALETNKKYFVFSEPEKFSLIPMFESIVSLLDSTDLVVPSRDSLESYSAFQQYSELFINEYFFRLTGLKLDVMFGPKMWRRDLSHIFLEYTGEYGDKWDAHIVPLMTAMKHNYSIESFGVDYEYPQEQKDIENDSLEMYEKRLNQMNNLFQAFTEYWKK